MTAPPQHQSDARELERRSSAVTLSDMELFIFPELLYALVLANLMSPRIWAWPADPWFQGQLKAKPYRRIQRLKQFIMDHYAFNLDLDTWGLTTRERELKRFSAFIAPEALAQSNALFGYEGDKYYFDIGIRKHFGLDKYDGNVIPYWKTETVEAMDAFRFKPSYGTGAGECVSLATLYAAALFIVARIPLDQIYLMATPLHSQNFVELEDGILTNNRRLVTKNMWFNGSALSAQARRALENERVTIVAHHTGVIHTLYNSATIAPTAYSRFSSLLRGFLKVRFTTDIFGNFLRQAHAIQHCFQIRHPIHGTNYYAPAERIFAYEHGSSNSFTDKTRPKLLAEVDREEFLPDPIPGRMILNELEDFVTARNIDLDIPEHVQMLKDRFCSECLNRDRVIAELLDFCHVKPRLPDPETKTFLPTPTPLQIPDGSSREELIQHLAAIRTHNPVADLAFYAYRDLSRISHEPFVLAAIQRNPVSVNATATMDLPSVEQAIRAKPDTSIYDEDTRLAQPDEFWNYGRGDGIEKALTLANILRARLPNAEITLQIDSTHATVLLDGKPTSFPTTKKLPASSWFIPSATS